MPAYLLHGIAALALIGTITVDGGVGSYTRMFWKVGNYNALRHDQETLKKQYRHLQSTVKDTNQRLDSLQSLATEVAMTYGVLRYHPAAFDRLTTLQSTGCFRPVPRAIHVLEAQCRCHRDLLRWIALVPSMTFADSTYTPAIWPVLGHITDGFGERLDPFSGEGAFHTGVDVTADYGAPVHATADGIVMTVDSTPATAASSLSNTDLDSPPGTHIFRHTPLSPVPASSGAKSSAIPESVAALPARTSTTKSA